MRRELIGRGVNFLGIDATQHIGVSAESAPSRADVDVQDRLWIKRRKNPRDLAAGFAQIRRDLLDILAVFGVFQKDHGEHAGALPGASRDREVFVDRWIGLKKRIEFVLELALLSGRAPS